MRKTIATAMVAACWLSAAAFSAGAQRTGLAVWYPHGASWIAALPTTSALPPVAVYPFRDARGEGPDHVAYVLPSVGVDPARKGPAPVRTSQPVVVPVATAFAEGLAARGFPVIDRTHQAFQVGDPTDGAKRGLRGEVLRFAIWPRWLVINAFEGRFALAPGGIVCAVSLEVFDPRTGENLWEKTYGGSSLFDEASSTRLERDMERGRMWEQALEPPLAAALAATVENAVMDPELAEILLQPGS